MTAGITGYVRIDDNGDRDADYSLIDLDPITGRFEVVAHYYGINRFERCIWHASNGFRFLGLFTCSHVHIGNIHRLRASGFTGRAAERDPPRTFRPVDFWAIHPTAKIGVSLGRIML